MEENTRTGRVLRTGYMLCWSFFLIIFLDALRIRTVSGEIQLIDISPAFPVLGAFLLLITETVCRTVRSAVSSKDTSPAGMYASLGSVLRRNDLKGLCAALLFGLVMYAAERSLFWLGMVPFFAAGSLFDKNTWLKPVLCTFLLRLALQTSLFALGLAEETVFTFSYGTCHSLGFENPNTPGLLVFLSFTNAAGQEAPTSVSRGGMSDQTA